MDFIFDNNSPIYIQLLEQLKIHIISGQISAGERLPSVRDFALKIKVNPNTLQRALGELEEIGLIYTERTNGKFVTDDSSLIEKYRREYADTETKKFISNMEKVGFNTEQAIKYLQNGGKDI